MILKKYVNYDEFGKYMIRFTDMLDTTQQYKTPVRAVYAPPRGGLPLATHIANHLNIELVLDLKQYIMGHITNGRQYVLIVDDICDSGQTFYQIHQLLNNYTEFITPIYASIFIKPRSQKLFTTNNYIEIVDDSTWVVFPWEKDNEPDKDYMMSTKGPGDDE